MKFLTLVIIGISTLSLFACGAGQNQVKKSSDCKAPGWVEGIPPDPEFYHGVGAANVGEEIGEALEQARARARNDISGQIKVNINSIATDLLSFSTDKLKTEEKEAFERITTTYIDQALNDCLPRERWVDECNKRVWVWMVLSREKHINKVEEDIRQKREMISGFFLEGLRAREIGDAARALGNWLKALDYVTNIYTELPVRWDLEGDGSPEVVRPSLQNRIGKLIGSLKVKAAERTIFFSSQGYPDKNPIFQLSIKSSGGRSAPVDSFPLKVSLVKGKAQIPEKILTGRLGTAEIKVERIDPSTRETVLKVEPDMESLMEGVTERPDLMRLPSAMVTFKKRESVAVVVRFKNAGSVVNAGGLPEKVRQIVIDKGYDAVDAGGYPGGRPSLDYLGSLYERGSDYLLIVNVTASPQKISGFELTGANASAKVQMFDLKNRSLAFSKSAGSERGFGLNGSAAGWEAMGKLQGKILGLVRNNLK